VVINHHCIHTLSLESFDALVVAGTTIARDEKTRSNLGDPISSSVTQPIASLKATSDHGNDIAAEGTNDFGEDGNGGYPIAVVVAEDDNPLVVTNAAHDAVNRCASVRHVRWGGQVSELGVQEGACSFVVLETAAMQQVGEGGGEVKRTREASRIR